MGITRFIVMTLASNTDSISNINEYNISTARVIFYQEVLGILS